MSMDQELEASHLPHYHVAIQPTNRNEQEQTNSSEARRRTDRHWRWTLSGFICLNILMLGCSLISGSTSTSSNITLPDLEVFFILLLLLTAMWMVYYIVNTAKNPNTVTYRDEHAGPIWLRSGLVLFGILSVAMDIFKIVGYVGYLHCDSVVKVVFPVVQLIFVVVQTYFLWIHSKDCVQLQKKLTSCALMLTLSTNLVIWMTGVTEESLHHTINPDNLFNTTKLSRRNLYIYRVAHGDESCTCSFTSCHFFKEAYYYLHPFNMEYCLYASAMVYVMWKNVGRVQTKIFHKVHFSLQDIFIGPTLGLVVVVAGLSTFSMYEVEMKSNYSDEDSIDKAVMMHFVMNIIILVLMSSCTAIGCAIYRVDHREQNNEKNPTRILDVGLLVGSSVGQFLISYFSIVAMVATGAKNYLDRLNLTWGLLMLIHLGLQNYFIVRGLYRRPFHVTEPNTMVINQFVAHSSQGEGHLERVDSEKRANPISDVHNRGAVDHYELKWKRQVLREVCVFLLMGNAILWIMPAFGARPQFDYDAESKFYKFSLWAIIVNVGLPFAMFYRMHSISSLFEVFLNS